MAEQPNAAFKTSASCFCTVCGTILSTPGQSDAVICGRCGAALPISLFMNVKVESKSREFAFQKPKFNTSKPQGNTDATVSNLCLIELKILGDGCVD
eukprot:m.13119 g.13119  ORF g.13119 m.13119 type:complete len:97 (-) comp10098_c0_seq1:19-309(-)